MNLLGGVVLAIAKLKVVWKAWDIRSFIVASFLFQLFLILVSPFRSRTSRLSVRISIWIVYLMADWVAAQAVGLIAKATQVSDSTETDLLGLWAQFLLLHLGGPDTITALALEDNELWLRTALHLGTQAYATLGILVRSVRQSTLWIATVLMFFAGIIKYLERVSSLQNGRLLDIVEDPYEEYMSDYMEDIDGERSLSDEDMVRFSYVLFQAYKSVYSDIKLDKKVADSTRKRFLKMTPHEAFKMVEIQLNFTYEAMYTKMRTIHTMLWRVLRNVVFLLEVASFVIWLLWDKRHFKRYDVGVTYALLIGAIVVDLMGFVRVQLSDWTVALGNNKSTCDLLTCNAWSRLQNINLSRNRLSIHIGLYDGSRNNRGSAFTDYLVEKLGLGDNEYTQGSVEFDSEISSKWDFIFEMLTNPNRQQSYELSTGVTLSINDILLQALPMNILDYSLILEFWYKVTKNLTKSHPCSQGDLCIALSRYLIYLISFRQNMMFGSAGKTMVDDNKQGIVLFSIAPELKLGYMEDEGEIVNDRTDNDLGLLTFESDRGSGGRSSAMRKMREIRQYMRSEKNMELLARIWGELVCHAAITCRPSVHAEKLKEGGEFLTFVWLLMMHLGVKDRKVA